MALSGDFIVGFPGESEREFEQTLELVRQVRYAQAFSFKYSARPGTPAAALPGQVPEPVKEERLARLQDLLNQHQADFNAAQSGRTLPVLFERIGRRPGQVVGRSPYLQPVHIDGPESLIGTIAPVQITQATRGSLTGRVAQDAMAIA